MQEIEKSVDREMLYSEVWAEPVSIVATRYGLTDVGLAKACRALAIPLPTRGYWAKVKAGRVMERVPLPAMATPNQSTGLVKLPPEQAAIREEARTSKARIRKEASIYPYDEVSTSPALPLVQTASKRLRQRGGWPANSLIREAPKEVLHLSVTRSALDRALSLVDILLKSLSKHGFGVEIEGERGVSILRRTETNTTLEFTLTEHVRRSRHEITPAEQRAKKRYWERSRWDSSATYPDIPMYDYQPTGNLTIQVGRWPSRTWRDTPKTKLEQRLVEVIAGIVSLDQETLAKEQEELRRKEA